MSAGRDGRGCEWRIAPEQRAETSALSRALGVPRLIAHLLIQRGVTTAEQGEGFLHPDSRNLSPPHGLPDMDAAVKRIRAALETQERVLVFGDYDVDGISGTAILVGALRDMGLEDVSCRLPQRLSEGYGLAGDHVREAHAEGVSLIITVDNGSTAMAAAETARSLGVDLVVTDHHQLENELPPACAVVNPKRLGPDAPHWDACGAAVAFKLAWALTGEMRGLDLAALGTVADIVPLLGENRHLVAAGLREIADSPRVGLSSLARVAGVKTGGLRAGQIAFQLAPRINAGGRLGDGTRALDLLTTDSFDEAARLADELNQANEERRAIEDRIYQDALLMADEQLAPGDRTIVLASQDWHPGVVGIVASRIQATHYKPVILIAMDRDAADGVVGRGSARSVGDFDIAAAIAACGEHLVKFGGHKGAAGLTVSEDRLDSFRTAFEVEARNRLKEEDLRRALSVDALVAFSEIDSRLVRDLERLEPFGHMNPSPVFCSFGVEVIPHSCRELRGGHLRLTLREGPAVLGAIAFRMGDRYPELAAAKRVDVAFTPQFNTWRNETTIQLVVKDIRVAG